MKPVEWSEGFLNSQSGPWEKFTPRKVAGDAVRTKLMTWVCSNTSKLGLEVAAGDRKAVEESLRALSPTVVCIQPTNLYQRLDRVLESEPYQLQAHFRN